MKRLHKVVNERGWIEQARQLDFSIRPVLLNHSLAKEFVSKWLTPIFKPKGTTLLLVSVFNRVGVRGQASEGR